MFETLLKSQLHGFDMSFMGSLFLWLLSQTNYMPKINPKQLCEWLQLCSIRNKDNQQMVAIKPLWQDEYEIPLDTIENKEEYQWLPIMRSYASWHVLFNHERTKIYLVATEKNGVYHRQVLGWSPREDNLKDIIVYDGDIIKFNLEKAEDNAILRWYNRTWIDYSDSYNELPLVDWVMAEKTDEWGVRHYRNLVLLLHYVVKSYHWDPQAIQVEWVVNGKRFTFDEVEQHPHIAPNAKIIIQKSLQLIKEQEL